MNHSNCLQNNSQIPNYRQRYNPTFIHQQIFYVQPLDLLKSRCTPTFHSTVLNNQGYNIKTLHKKIDKQIIRPSSALKGVYLNNSQRKRIQDLNPHNPVYNLTGDHWFDHTKQNMINTLKDCKNYAYSKQRKYLDMTSDPVFTDYNYGNSNIVKNQSKIVYLQKQTVNNNHQNQQNVVPIQNIQPIIEEKINQNTNNSLTKNIPQQRKKETKKAQSSHKKDYHINCIPEIQKQLKLKGKKINQRPQTARKANVISQKPTFTVIRKNRIPPSN